MGIWKLDNSPTLRGENPALEIGTMTLSLPREQIDILVQEHNKDIERLEEDVRAAESEAEESEHLAELLLDEERRADKAEDKIKELEKEIEELKERL